MEKLNAQLMQHYRPVDRRQTPGRVITVVFVIWILQKNQSIFYKSKAGNIFVYSQTGSVV